MTARKKTTKKTTNNKKTENSNSSANDFAKIFTEFGSAMAKVFDDPKLKKKAKELGQATVVSAKTLGQRFEDKQVQKKFRDVGKAAKKFGGNVAKKFK